MNNLETRHTADRILAEKASQRIRVKDASMGGKTAAFIISKAMKTKTHFGLGLKYVNVKNKKKKKMKKRGKGLKKMKKKRSGKGWKKCTLKNIIKAAASTMISSPCSKKVIKTVLKGTREAVKK